MPTQGKGIKIHGYLEKTIIMILMKILTAYFIKQKQANCN